MSSLSRFRLITFDVTDTLISFRTAPGKQYGEIGALFGINQDDHHDLVARFRENW
jgi:FMN phosphatase YigB (HAD superfamily)